MEAGGKVTGWPAPHLALPLPSPPSLEQNILALATYLALPLPLPPLFNAKHYSICNLTRLALLVAPLFPQNLHLLHPTFPSPYPCTLGWQEALGRSHAHSPMPLQCPLYLMHRTQTCAHALSTGCPTTSPTLSTSGPGTGKVQGIVPFVTVSFFVRGRLSLLSHPFPPGLFGCCLRYARGGGRLTPLRLHPHIN